MFLTHWTAGILVSRLFFDGQTGGDSGTVTGGAAFFFATLVAVLMLSALFYEFIDRPIERVRRAIRPPSRNHHFSPA
jgi:peptidoglycan/LPS O-acetylase OafA/YrhL